MQQVMPCVPAFGTAVESAAGTGLAPVERDPHVIRDALVAVINRDSVVIDDPRSPDCELDLVKTETYAIVGATALQMQPFMVRGTGTHARFTDEVTEGFDAVSRQFRPVFGNGFQAATRAHGWLGPIAAHFDPLFADYMRLSNTGGMRRFDTDHLAFACNGAAYSRTMRELGLLAAKLQDQAGDTAKAAGASDDDLLAWYSRRRDAMHGMVNLTVARSGLNMFYFNGGGASGLQHLEGTLTSNDAPASASDRPAVFRRSTTTDGKERWSQVFADTDPDDAIGPTLKCPFHRTLRELVHAGINLQHDTGTLLTRHDRQSVTSARIGELLAAAAQSEDDAA